MPLSSTSLPLPKSSELAFAGSLSKPEMFHTEQFYLLPYCNPAVCLNVVYVKDLTSFTQRSVDYTFWRQDWMESTHFEGQLQTASWQTSIDDIANKPRSILQTRMACYDSEWLIASLVWRTLFCIFYGWVENHSSGPVVKWMYYTKGTVSNALRP